MNTYMVTGATGFLGASVVRALEARGHRVIGFSRATGGDVLHADSLRAAAKGCDGVFHCAGKVSRAPQDAEELYTLHVGGTKNVVDACASAGVPRVVCASTSGTVAVSDSADQVATEDDAAPIALLSRWPYYRSKLFAEREALAANRPGLAVVCVNPSLLLGPGDLRGSSTNDVRRFLEGAIPAVPTGGLSFVDVRDAAEAMCLAMEHGAGGERYLVGACNLTVRQFFERLARISGVPAPWMPMPRSRRLAGFAVRCMHHVAERIGVPSSVDAASLEMAQSFWYLDASKAERALGWKPRDPGQTLHDTVEDLRGRGVVWPLETGVNERRPITR